MSWSGGSYTKGNAATGGWVGDASLGIGIEAGRHDNQDNDFATGINQCLNKDGSNSATGNLNLGGFLPTNIGSGTAAAPAICAGNDVNTGIFSPAADQIGIATNGTERVRISDTGRVGIGTTAPGTALHVSSSGDAVLRIEGTGGADNDQSVHFKDTTSDWYIGNRYGGGSPSNQSFGIGRTAAKNDVVIDSSGRVGIGTTAPYASLDTPTFQIGVSGTAADNFHFTAGSGELNFWNGNYGTGSYLGTLTSTGFLGLGVVPSYRLQLSTDSAAKPTTNTWTISSDARIKTNIEPYQKGLAEICQVNPITYDYNGKGGIPAGPGGVSILAQEIQPVFPECVGSFKGKLNEDDEKETDILNYNGHAITFALINAIKELNAKVEALEARVAELEA